MKRFLPTLPAFLICLAGGKFLPLPKNDAPVGVPAMVGWLPNQVAGYQEWMANTKEMAMLESETENAAKVLEALTECEPKVNEVKELIKLKNKALLASEELDKSKAALTNLANDKTHIDKGPFPERAKWWKDFQTAWKNHENMLTPEKIKELQDLSKEAANLKMDADKAEGVKP